MRIWTKKETDRLLAMKADGLTLAEMATSVGVTKAAVAGHLYRLDPSKPKTPNMTGDTSYDLKMAAWERARIGAAKTLRALKEQKKNSRGALCETEGIPQSPRKREYIEDRPILEGRSNV